MRGENKDILAQTNTYNIRIYIICIFFTPLTIRGANTRVYHRSLNNNNFDLISYLFVSLSGVFSANVKSFLFH